MELFYRRPLRRLERRLRVRGVLAVILSAAARPFLARRRDRQYLQLSTDLSPFLLLDRKLHFGDVVARVHVLRVLEMNQAG